jgi:ribosomal-protein-serine acetyltransferase
VGDVQIELGGGAVLRSLSPDDGDAMFEVIDRNRVRLARWFLWADEAVDGAEQSAWIEQATVEDGSPLAPCGIWVNDELAGNCNLWISAREQVGNLVYWLDEAFVGRGLVTRAAQALLERGFNDEGLHRVEVRAGVDNLRSRAVAKRLKMREEGVLRGAGKVGGGLFVDMVVYGLLEDEWRKSV